MDVLKPVFKNPGEHPMSNDVQQLVTVDMVHDAETLKNALIEDDSLCT